MLLILTILKKQLNICFVGEPDCGSLEQSMSNDANLQRFLNAQEGVYDTVLDELRAGRKSSHWSWLIFPQIAGLGRSGMAQQFAIGSLDEASLHYS